MAHAGRAVRARRCTDVALVVALALALLGVRSLWAGVPAPTTRLLP
jgi:hypothetical protein